LTSAWTLAGLLLLAGPAGAGAQQPPLTLDAEMAALDTALFGAFNDCDASRFSALLADDVEFFHDKAGLMRKAFLVDDLARTCVRRLKGEQPKVRRELAGTAEAYPIKDYGAVQTGAHRFYEIAGGKETLVGTGRFLHVWKKEAGGWKLARVVSYDHRPAP
jgi:ketosteroid isomerase-like protein